MKAIKRNIGVLKEYDVLLVDAYGVFRNGDQIIPGSHETFKTLMNAGKIVLVLSNTTQRSDKAVAGYKKKGIEMGVHCHDIVTSGEIAYNMIQKQQIQFKGMDAPRKVYCFGTLRKELFENSVYELVPMEKADFVYISIPQLKEHEVAGLSSDIKKELFVSNLFEENVYDSLVIDPFLPMLEKCKSFGLPALNANPDMTALENVKPIAVEGVQTGDEEPHYVVRQGMIAEAYQSMGMQVIQTGKPYLQAFQFCLDILKRDYGYTDETLKKVKIGMIGDTLETDILGAQNASKSLGVSIDGILTLTGNTAKDIPDEIKFNPDNEGELRVELQKIFGNADINPNVIIEKFVD